MDTVFISGLKATSVIGCYDWERDIRQTLMIDLELKADFTRAAGTDAWQMHSTTPPSRRESLPSAMSRGFNFWRH